MELPQREPTKYERERRSFSRLLPQLLATHRGQYVAIHEEKIAASGADRMEVLGMHQLTGHKLTVEVLVGGAVEIVPFP